MNKQEIRPKVYNIIGRSAGKDNIKRVNDSQID